MSLNDPNLVDLSTLSPYQRNALPRPSYQTTQIVWLDVNTNIGLNTKSDLLPNVQAINNSIYNIINCPIGSRGPIFQPEYGCLLWQLIQEPCDYITANNIQKYLVQAIQRWEPRITLNMQLTSVYPTPQADGYYIRVVYNIISPQSPNQTAMFQVNR